MFKPLSEEFLLKRGFCCKNNCKNCPYKNLEQELHEVNEQITILKKKKKELQEKIFKDIYP